MAVEFDIAQLHRLSVDEYHRILEAGGIDEDAHVELLEGLLVETSPKTRAHLSQTLLSSRSTRRGPKAQLYAGWGAGVRTRTRRRIRRRRELSGIAA